MSDNGGQYLFSSSSDGTIRVWSLEHKESVCSFYEDGEAISLAISPDDNLIIAGTVQGGVHLLLMEGLNYGQN